MEKYDQYEHNDQLIFYLNLYICLVINLGFSTYYYCLNCF